MVSLTDYDTKSELAPDRAYVVEGSSLHPCGARSMPGSLSQQSASKHSVPCEPSILAFASREDAAKFSRERGGSVLRFEELAAQFPH